MSNSSNKTNNKKIPLVSITTAIQFFVTISFVIICVFFSDMLFMAWKLAVFRLQLSSAFIFFYPKSFFCDFFAFCCLRSSNLKQTFRAFFTMILFSPFFHFQLNAANPLGPPLLKWLLPLLLLLLLLVVPLLLLLFGRCALTASSGGGSPSPWTPLAIKNGFLITIPPLALANPENTWQLTRGGQNIKFHFAKSWKWSLCLKSNLITLTKVKFDNIVENSNFYY